MTTHPHPLSPEDWEQLKAVWFAIADTPHAEHAVLLERHALSEPARRELARMLAVSDADAAMLDQSSHLARGLEWMLRSRTDAPLAHAPDRDMIGQRLGPFVVTRLVARGGMGAVYEAHRADEAYAQRIAVKTLWRGVDSHVLLQRFRSERQILAGLQHPNISQLVDGGTTMEGTPWLAMEYVDGEPIDAWCDRRSLTIPQRLDLFRQVCAAVHHAHQRLVVHRDLKPGNVFVNTDGTVKLLDFGVAKLMAPSRTDSGSTLTDAGLSPLTAAYAAPEQVSGEEVSTATDVFALGALLCTLLAGAPPHDLTNVDGVDRLIQVRDGTPRSPSVVAAAQPASCATARGFSSAERLAQALRGELDAIVQMAVRRDPARRYASAEALADDVRRFLRRDRVLARPDTAGYRLWSFVRRNRAVAVATGVVLATIVGSTALMFRQAVQLRAEADRAERAAAFLAGIVSGANATSTDPLVQLPPQATLAQLLDSALLRVPRVFGNDDAMRARLYTAIGANLASQGRLVRARDVLDSARQLARRTEGAASVTSARAHLEYALLLIDLSGPAAADSSLSIATQWASRNASDVTFDSRLLLVRATQALSFGAMHRADSLATIVVQREQRQGQRTLLSVRAESIRLAASSWIRRDPREYLRRARGVNALADSLGLAYSLEQVRAQAAEIEALLVLGRVAPAAEASRQWQAAMRQSLSVSDGVEASIAQLQSFVSAVQGDRAARRENAERAWRIAQLSADVPLSSRMLIANTAVDDALARGDVQMAQQIANNSVATLRASRSPLLLSFAELYAGTARLAAGDARGAEAALRAGLAHVSGVPDLASMAPRLRRPLADALRRQQRVAEADSVAALDVPREHMPPCQPGGDWRGCADND